MPIVIAVLTLLAGLVADAKADAVSDSLLAKRFSPILILAKETGHKWGDIKVIKPEPVEIMGAQSAENLRFWAVSGTNQNKKTNNKRDGIRIAKKLGTDALLGNIVGLLSILPLVGDDNGNGIFGIGFFNTWLIGHMVGTSIGVTKVDPHDHFIMPLTGSLVGTVVGMRSSSYGKGLGWFGILPTFVCPVAFSTIMSELWRTPPEGSRLSINLAPSPKGHLLVASTLRF